MHNGVIYIRGKVDKLLVAGQIDMSEPGVEDRKVLDKFVGEFVESFPDLGLNKRGDPERRFHQACTEIEEALCEDVCLMRILGILLLKHM
jgi:hypothetical protein